jgi:hypothetical protein
MPPTEQMPRISDEQAAEDDTGPISIVAGTSGRPADDGGPPTMLGAPPLTDDEPTTVRPDDDGPPTVIAEFDLDDPLAATAVTAVTAAPDTPDTADAMARTAVHRIPDRPAGLGDAGDVGDSADHGDLGLADRRPGERGDLGDIDELDHRGDLDELDDEDDDHEVDARPQAWAVVIGQWIAGAIAGALLWVGFRFLWFNLPVVALAAAVLVTVALVLGVRALLRNDDLRTTIFAVLVGLLLTVSPAILVLLGR